MRNLLMLGGFALSLAGTVVAADVGLPGGACTGPDCQATSSFEPQPIATVPVAMSAGSAPAVSASPTSFTPPVPMMAPAAVTQAVPPAAREAAEVPPVSAKPLPEAVSRVSPAPSGDVDVDFVRGMIAHHQAGIEMAKAQLINGKDPDMKMLANDIMKAQGNEIEIMQKWLALHGPRPVAAPEAAKPKPRPPVVKAKAKPIGELLHESNDKPVPPAMTAPALPAEAAPARAASPSVSATAVPATGVVLPPAGKDMPMPLLDDMSEGRQ